MSNFEPISALQAQFCSFKEEEQQSILNDLELVYCYPLPSPAEVQKDIIHFINRCEQVRGQPLDPEFLRFNSMVEEDQCKELARLAGVSAERIKREKEIDDFLAMVMEVFDKLPREEASALISQWRIEPPDGK